MQPAQRSRLHARPRPAAEQEARPAAAYTLLVVEYGANQRWSWWTLLLPLVWTGVNAVKLGLQNVYENSQTLSSDYTVTNGSNAMAAGPITIASGVTVTVGSGETLTIV